MPSRHPDIARAHDTALVVVDVQEQFRPHIPGFDAMVAEIRLLAAGCAAVGVPSLVTEQYPRGLGATAAELADVAAASHSFEKLEISAPAADGWGGLPADLAARGTWVVAGLETHVCVAQTALDLLHQGKRVQVVADAVGSRDPWQREVALERLARAGATVTSVEGVLFELLVKAGTSEFKAVQALIKEHDAAMRALDDAAMEVAR